MRMQLEKVQESLDSLQDRNLYREELGLIDYLKRFLGFSLKKCY